MNSRELAEAGLPGVGYAIAEAPGHWPAHGVAVWPEGGDVGIRCFNPTENPKQESFGCTTCGWGSQPWPAWVSLAKRILAADEAMAR